LELLLLYLKLIKAKEALYQTITFGIRFTHVGLQGFLVIGVLAIFVVSGWRLVG
jgi:hypothetical protein